MAVTEGLERRPLELPESLLSEVDCAELLAAEGLRTSKASDFGDGLRVSTCSRGRSICEFHSGSSLIGELSILKILLQRKKKLHDKIRENCSP